MLKPVDVLMVGVGGQGTILASNVLSTAAQLAGYDIKMSEIHGMAQRGGSVSTQVRLGEKVYSPLICEGAADVIMAFEKLEALRWLDFLKPGGSIIINDQAIAPVPVLAGLVEYPAGIIEAIKARVPETLVMDAFNIARACGEVKAANVVLVGALARRMPIPIEIWLRALEARVPPKFIEANRAAFNAGYQL